MNEYIGIGNPMAKYCANERVNYSGLIECLLHIGHKAPGKSNLCALVIPYVHSSRHEAHVKLASVNLSLPTTQGCPNCTNTTGKVNSLSSRLRNEGPVG
jgi:hypothetical protein